MNDLKVFDSLTADITLFVAPIKQLSVRDPVQSQVAIDVAKCIKDYVQRVEAKRKELVGPLNAQIKAINDYCKTITAPLIEADFHVRTELNSFATEQEKIRRAEAERVERERLEAERLAREERERVEAELRARQEAEAAERTKAASLFGADEEDEAAEAEHQARQERERAEQKAELDRQAAIRASEFKKKEWDANQLQIKNTRANLKVRVLDINLIPKEFLIITPNEKALVAAGKAGVKIAGVEFYEEIAVAIGRTTRMPGVR